MVHQDFPASAFCELILKCRSNKISANVTHTPQKYFQCHRKSEPFGTGRSQGFCWLCHSSGVIGIHKCENKVGVKHRTQDMSDSILWASGTSPEMLQRVSGEINPEFQTSFVTTKAADIPFLGIPIPHGAHGGRGWNPPGLAPTAPMSRCHSSSGRLPDITRNMGSSNRAKPPC